MVSSCCNIRTKCLRCHLCWLLWRFFEYQSDSTLHRKLLRSAIMSFVRCSQWIHLCRLPISTNFQQWTKRMLAWHILFTGSILWNQFSMCLRFRLWLLYWRTCGKWSLFCDSYGFCTERFAKLDTNGSTNCCAKYSAKCCT